MPGNLLTADTSFPRLTKEQSTEEKFGILTNYLYMLLEQLRYSMANLGMENFNRTELDNLAGFITQPVYIRLESTEGDISTLYATAESLSSRMTNAEGGLSSLIQTVDGFTLAVQNGTESSKIQLLSNGVEISSQIIRMDGLVTFTGLAEGTTTIDGGCIRTGTIDAARLNLSGAITFNDLSSSLQGDLNSAAETADAAYSLAAGNRLPNYIKNTYIDATEIRSPTIRANEFSVFPDTDGTGSFNLYGQYGEALYEMMSISYYPGDAPYVNFGSPAGAFVNWNFFKTFFSGAIDFSGADVTGLYLRFS